MKLEVRMNTLSDEIQDQVKAGRRTVEKSFGEIKEIDVRQLPPVAFLAAGVAVAAVAVGMGWIVYRSRRRRTLVQRLQDALPEGVRELPGGLRDQVRRAL
ncbi:MAG: hypothetical protein AUG94_00645 [Actinobacteria bacterium 13_1_20CM_4_66_15]|nr:MAG: hypothetical protein AUG94_00645 [Actinobacteria bacterium 13_1_20CM_4_66_15]TMD77668.1 MAG: hypothetical protein E6I82_01955 [Chloroflexota bacterium]